MVTERCVQVFKMHLNQEWAAGSLPMTLGLGTWGFARGLTQNHRFVMDHDSVYIATFVVSIVFHIGSRR
jgi:hypothetical protein